jgi:two-component system cell cycle sensor histidine kinase/response regulator CckA
MVVRHGNPRHSRCLASAADSGHSGRHPARHMHRSRSIPRVARATGRCVRPARGSSLRVNPESDLVRDQEGNDTQFVHELWRLRRRVADLEARERELEEARKDLLSHAQDAAALLNVPPETCAIISPEGRILAINDIGAAGLGRAPEELVGTSVHDVFPADLNAARMARLTDVLRTGEAAMFEDESSGALLSNRFYPIRDEHGEIVRIAVFSRDVTEQKRTEQELRISEKKYRSLFDRSPSLMMVIGSDGKVKDINRATLESLRYAREDLIGEDSLSFVVPEDRPRAAERLEANFRGETVEPQETGVYAKNGSIHTFLCTPAVLVDDEEGAPAALFSGTDVTERGETRRALHESEERYRAIFEESTDVVYITSRDGKLIDISPSAESLFGRPRLELIGADVRPLYADPEERMRFQREIEERGFVKEFEVRFLGPDGSELYCLLTSSLRRDADGAVIGYHGIIRDITDRRRAEDERESMEAQLLQAQKMEAVGTLASGVAHDFNNLLTAIQGFADLAMSSAEGSGRLYGDLRKIRSAADRGAALTRQLLLFSRRQSVQRVPLDLNRTAKGLLGILSPLIGEDVAMKTDLEPELRPVLADEGSIQQIIMNLAVNARDAMPEGGRLVIATKNVDFDDEPASGDPGARAGEFVSLSVTDTGVGMDPVTVQRVLEPFFSTKDPGKGTGLGLSVVYGIVQQHEGWLDIRSTPGRGSTFEIYLPATSARPDRSLRSSEYQDWSLTNTTGQGERILVVEDEGAVRELAVKVLRQSGYEVLEAGTVAAALSVFEEQEGHFDLIFSDVILPDHTGIRLAEMLPEMKPDLPFLLSSGHDDDRSRYGTIRGKGLAFLRKPYSLPDLLRTVREIVAPN